MTEIVKAAQEAMERAYAPYSNFSVGAAVRGRSGRIYSGCNIENAAYPQGWCAEVSAISAMIMSLPGSALPIDSVRRATVSCASLIEQLP